MLHTFRHGRRRQGWCRSLKRLIAKLDPRGYEVHPVGPPDATQLVTTTSWRFWNRLPSAGRIGIFDRSWYGRVLVERVEKLATKQQWSRAYEQIDDFERALVEEGLVLLKFWVHISQEEQLRRFKARERTRSAAGDHEGRLAQPRALGRLRRRRGKEMLAKTSTTDAPGRRTGREQDRPPSSNKKKHRHVSLGTSVGK